MTLNSVTDFLCGRITRRTLLRVLIPLIFFAYFGTLAFAIRAVPGPFDWRYKSISKLLYPETDPELPALHLMVSIGIGIAGFLMIPFAGYVGRRFRRIAPVLSRLGTGAFGAGAVILILAATITSQPSGGSRAPALHEMLARVCGFGLGIGMLAFYFCAAKSRAGSGGYGAPDRRLFIAWNMIAPPAAFIAAVRGLAALRLRWPDPICRAIQNRALWHLGFWEWIGSGAVFLFLLSAALFLPQSERASPQR